MVTFAFAVKEPIIVFNKKICGEYYNIEETQNFNKTFKKNYIVSGCMGCI